MNKNLWTKEQLLLVFNLYCKIPFGQFHKNNLEVIKLAHLIGRTPSAVAMKLTNFASLDPFHQSRGIQGLGNTSKLDQETWLEFTSDWNKAGEESEALLEELEGKQEIVEAADTDAEYPITERTYQLKVRLGQKFFRETILANYRACCICGIPIRQLLIASHIIPWRDREDLRLNPCNGLCLCAIHDKAFDMGLITINPEYEVLIGAVINHAASNEALVANFERYRGHKISLPEKFIPKKEFLLFHNQTYFLS